MRRISPLRKIRWTPSLVREVAQISQSEEEGYTHYTPLIPLERQSTWKSRTKFLTKPDPMKLPTDRRKKYKYCDFHEDIGHNTFECFSLRNQIEGLVRGGLLIEFLQQVKDGIKMRKKVQKELQEPEERRKDKIKDLMEKTLI